MKKIIFIFILFMASISSQDNNVSNSASEISITGSQYYTGEDGLLKVFVNIWGHVNNPGRIMVNEGIDVVTLLSITGGPKKGADIKHIYVYREFPDKNGESVYIINLQEFVNTGNRDGLIQVLPNDTYIISQTFGSFLLEKVGTINTIMSLVNLYFNIESRK